VCLSVAAGAENWSHACGHITARCGTSLPRSHYGGNRDVFRPCYECRSDEITGTNRSSIDTDNVHGPSQQSDPRTRQSHIRGGSQLPLWKLSATRSPHPAERARHPHQRSSPTASSTPVFKSEVRFITRMVNARTQRSERSCGTLLAGIFYENHRQACRGRTRRRAESRSR